MPTPAQNRVYEAYGIRKGALEQRMRKSGQELFHVSWISWDRVVSDEEIERAKAAIHQLAFDSAIWQAYRKAEKEEAT